jgi:hypothetical protein
LCADAHDGLDKNDHFQHMLCTANARGFRPERVAFDSWYASLSNCHRWQSGISGFQATANIVRDAIRATLALPGWHLTATA